MTQLRKSSATKFEPHFRTDHLQADLKGRSIRGGAVTAIAQLSKFILQTGSTIVLARLLTPQDYGLIGMVTSVTGFIGLFKDMGLSMATVQRAEINHRQVSTLFWVNVVLSCCLAVLTAALAPVIAWFYSEPRLTTITVVLASGYIFSGLGVQHAALLSRQMRYRALAITDLIALAIGIIVAIISAWCGASYWALVFMPITIGIVNTSGDWIMCGWQPGLPKWDSNLPAMLAFGGNLTGAQIITYLCRNLDNVLIGRYWGSQQLGLYAKAYQLLVLPLLAINSPIRNVAIPTLSRLVDSPQRYRQAYLSILEKIIMIAMPIVSFLVATSDWLVLLLLGPQWSDANRIFKLLSIIAFVQPISYTTGWLFISQGRTGEMFRWGIFSGSITIISIVAGLPWGAEGVAAAYSITGLFISTPLLYWYVGRTGPIRTADFYRIMAPSLCASLSTLLVLLAFRRWVEVSNPLTGIAIALIITAVTTLTVFAILPSGRLALQDFRSLLTLVARNKHKKSG